MSMEPVLVPDAFDMRAETLRCSTCWPKEANRQRRGELRPPTNVLVRGRPVEIPRNSAKGHGPAQKRGPMTMRARRCGILNHGCLQYSMSRKYEHGPKKAVKPPSES